MMENKARKFVDLIGEDALKRLGMTKRTIRHVRSAGSFAAQWYLPLKEIAEQRGVFCDPAMFNWKAPAKSGGKHNAAHRAAE